MTVPALTPFMKARHAAAVLSAEVGGSTVFMSVEQGCYLGLDEIGTEIWRRLEESIVIADLVAVLADEYDADPATIEREVLDLLARMAAYGLVEVG